MSATDRTAPTIAFVVPYVGSWPLWFPAYLQSCRYNPSIRWIFYTDCEIPTTVPANVQFVNGSLRDFERLFERKTGMGVSLELPYKVCDYKPAFGLIFEDYLHGVDFWGHCDVDVVWGNIRKFLATDEILSRYDVVSPRRRRIAGTCTLYRNTDEVNRLFLADRKFELVVRERENRRYDEKGWSRFVRKQSDNGSLRVSWSKWMQPRGVLDSVDEWYWERGAVFDCTDKSWWDRPRTTCSSIRTRCRARCCMWTSGGGNGRVRSRATSATRTTHAASTSRTRTSRPSGPSSARLRRVLGLDEGPAVHHERGAGHEARRR